MNIIQKFISHNRSGERLAPCGIVLHETATPNATADAEFNYFNTTNREASVHAFVDVDKIIQTVPYDEVAWGSGWTSNHKFLQVELCHYDDSRFEQVYKNAVEYFAYLLKEVIKNSNASSIYSHDEISRMYHETAHTDPVGYFNAHGKSVAGFRNDVANLLKGEDIVKDLVVYSGLGDMGAAMQLADFLHAPIMSKENFDAAQPKAEKIFMVGGDVAPSGAVLLSGQSRFDTAEKVCEFIRQ